jgi:hypothetical protein
MTFLAKCVFLMANDLEQELNIDGILLEICSTCVRCPGQSINICFLSDTARQRSSSNFSSRGILLKLLVFTLIFSYIQVVPMKCD